ncbi:hypothetical protein ABG775_11430 [Peribacillus simplex]|nr:hypothetical protein [Brevibacillus sp. JNUCC-41]QOS88998.1 hypothetical protein JNUCC41_19730 [Brevibacillus sp. JNUCC-41]
MFVPILDHADEKPIKEIAKDVRETGQKVHMNKKIIETPFEIRGIIW